MIACIVLGSSGVARAELTDVELEARGEALAKSGRYAEAIDAFKAADHIHMRAHHACLIALGYARRDLWFQAEIWLATCHERARPDDPVPEWDATLDQQIASHFTDPGIAPVVIAIEPRVAGMRISLVDFPEATFTPRTLHLPLGHHELVVDAPHYEGRQAFELGDTTEHRVVVAAHALVWHAANPARGRTLIAGGVLAGLGTISFAIMGTTYFRLSSSDRYNNSQPSALETTYDVTRVTTIGLWALGAGFLITGALLHHDAETPVVSAAPIPGGGMVTIGWTR